ncbi:MAG: MMPL family transporter [Myxococcota bacterium]
MGRLHDRRRDHGRGDGRPGIATEPQDDQTPTGRRIERRFTRALSAWVGFSARHPVAVLATLAIATVLVGASSIGRLGVNADENAMLSDQMPHRLLELEYHARFPALYENLLVVVDGPTPEATADAARSLAARMRRRPDLFSSVFLPQGPFFQENALLYMSTEDLEDFGDRLARIQPYLSGLAEDGTLRGLADLMGRGVMGVRKGEVEGDMLFPVVERIREVVAAELAGDHSPLSWTEAVAGHELDVDARRQFLLARPMLDFSDIAPARGPVTGVQQIAAELGLDADSGFQVRMTGDFALAFEEMQIVESQAASAGFASFLIVSAILFFALRSVRLVVATITTLLVGLVWTAGFAAWAIGHLNLISVAFSVLYIGLAVDFGLHFCLRYLELRSAGRDHDRALSDTASSVGASLVLCAATTSIGFYAFAPTEFFGVAELGIIAGTGMIISLVLAFTLLPALMSLGVARGGEVASVGAQASLPQFPIRHPRVVGTGAVALFAAACFVLPEVRFDINPLRVRDPSADSVQVLEELLARGTATPWELNAMAEDLVAAEELAGRLRELDVVAEAITVTDFIPGDQDEKLALIEDVALFLPPLPAADGRAPVPSDAERLEALEGLHFELGLLLEASGDEPWIGTARGFREDLGRLVERARSGSEPELLGGLEESLLGTLGSQLETLQAALSASTPITLETLPEGLMERMVSPEGLARVRILPAQDLGDDEALAAFVNGVREVAPEITGGAINIYEASRVVVRSLQQALTAAVLVIALLLFLIWRTLGDTALVLAPLCMAAVFTGATAVLVGIPFNFADIIVLPLLMGIGVDSGIHLVHRARGDADRLLTTSTARAVVFSSLTTIASFGTLGFAGHRGMASLGQLLTLGVALTVVCNLFVLPALIAWRDRRRPSGDRAVGSALV